MSAWKPAQGAHVRGPKRLRPLTPEERWRETMMMTGIGIPLAIVLVAFFLGRGLADHALVNALAGAGLPRLLMAGAGWLTVAFLPYAVATLIVDRRRHYPRTVEVYRAPAAASATVDPEVTQLITRIRADDGHRVAPPPRAYWLRRIPLFVAIVAAGWFWPIRGSSLGEPWRATVAGMAFNNGWRLSLAATAVAMILVVAEPWITAWARRDLVRPLALILSGAALATALLFA